MVLAGAEFLTAFVAQCDLHWVYKTNILSWSEPDVAQWTRLISVQ